VKTTAMAKATTAPGTVGSKGKRMIPYPGPAAAAAAQFSGYAAAVPGGADAVGGDEFGRTQQGNNNTYCQDSELSWFDWALSR
jgi:hypothetical protein